MDNSEMARRIGTLRGRGNVLQQGLQAQMGIGQQAQQQMLANQAAARQAEEQKQKAAQRAAEREADRLAREEEKRQEDLREEERYKTEQLRKTQEREEDRKYKRQVEEENRKYQRQKYEDDVAFERQREAERHAQRVKEERDRAARRTQEEQAKWMLEQAEKQQEAERKRREAAADPVKKLERETAIEKQRRLDAARAHVEAAKQTPEDDDDIAAADDLLKELNPVEWQRNVSERDREAERFRKQNDPENVYKDTVATENLKRFKKAQESGNPDDVLEFLNPPEYERRQREKDKPKKENQAKRIDLAADEVDKLNKELLDAQTRAKRSAIEEATKRAGAGRAGRYKEEDVQKLYKELLPKYEDIEGVEVKKQELMRRANRIWGNPELSKPGPGGGGGPSEDVLQSMGTDEEVSEATPDDDDFFGGGSTDREPNVLAAFNYPGQPGTEVTTSDEDEIRLNHKRWLQEIFKSFPDANLSQLNDPKVWSKIPEDVRLDMAKNPDKYFIEQGLEPDYIAQFGPIVAARAGAVPGVIAGAEEAGAGMGIGQRFLAGALTSPAGGMAGGEIGHEIAGPEGAQVGSVVGALPGAVMGGFLPGAAGEAALQQAGMIAGEDAAAAVGAPPILGGLIGGYTHSPKTPIEAKMKPHVDTYLNPNATAAERAEAIAAMRKIKMATKEPLPEASIEDFKNAAPDEPFAIDEDVLAQLSPKSGTGLEWWQLQDELDGLQKVKDPAQRAERLDKLEQNLRVSQEQGTVGPGFVEEISRQISRLREGTSPTPWRTPGVLEDTSPPGPQKAPKMVPTEKPVDWREPNNPERFYDEFQSEIINDLGESDAVDIHRAMASGNLAEIRDVLEKVQKKYGGSSVTSDAFNKLKELVEPKVYEDGSLKYVQHESIEKPGQSEPESLEYFALRSAYEDAKAREKLYKQNVKTGMPPEDALNDAQYSPVPGVEPVREGPFVSDERIDNELVSAKDAKRPSGYELNVGIFPNAQQRQQIVNLGKAVGRFITNQSDLESKLAIRSAAAQQGVHLPFETRVNIGPLDLRDAEEIIPEIADIVRVPVADAHVRTNEVMKNVQPFFEGIKPNSKLDQVIAYKPQDTAALMAAGGQEAVDAAYIMQHEYFKLWEKLKNSALTFGTPEEIKFWKGRKAPSNYITFFRNNYNKIFGDGKYSRDVMSKWMTPPKKGTILAGDSAIEGFETYAAAAVRKLELGTAISDAREAMKHYGNDVFGRGQKMFAEMYLNRLEGKAPLGQQALDYLSEVASKATGLNVDVSKIAVGMRTATSLAILGLNQGVALTNGIFGALATIAGPNFRKAMKEYFKQGYKKSSDILENLQLSHMEPRARIGKRNITSWHDLFDASQYHSLHDKVQKVMFSSMDFTNNLTAGMAYWQGSIHGRIQGGKAGLTGKALDEFANGAGVRRALEVQNIGITVERAPLFSDPAFGLVSQFVRPAVKQADLVIRKMGGQALKGNGAPLVKYMAATGATIVLAKQLFGVDLKEKLLGFLNPSEVGGLKRIFSSSESPIARLAEDLYNSGAYAVQGNFGKAGKSLGKAAVMSMPGGVQARRLVQAYLEDEKDTHGIITNRSTADRIKKGLTGYKTDLDSARSALNKAYAMPHETDDELDKRAEAISDAQDVLLNFVEP